MPPKRKRELDIPGRADFPGQLAGMSEAQWTACRSMLEAVYRRKEGSINIAEIFCQLPDRELYEDYYVTISEPECLDNIAVGRGRSRADERRRWESKSLARPRHSLVSWSWCF